jgi:hypothetical protein
VDEDLLGGYGLVILAGSFEELAVDEGGTGANEYSVCGRHAVGIPVDRV